jgi:hypothetical protein
LGGMVDQVYRPRRPKASPLWQCLSGHFDAFLELYEEQYQPRYGFLRPIIPEVVNKFLDCGDLERGFARVRCDDCKHEYLLAFSCKGRWFCPSCHQKKVQLFGALLSEAVLFPVPHRHFTFGIPKMLRPYFRHDRDLLKDLCRLAHECLLEYLRTTLNLTEGCSKFMQSLLTAYTVYYNLRHGRHGYLLDGRYKAKLVEGDDYLLALSRYVHLNPVCIGSMNRKTIQERIHALRAHRWSSYPSYIGQSKTLDFVEYEPLLAAMHGKRSPEFRNGTPDQSTRS